MRKTITWVLDMAGTHWGWMDDAENDLKVAKQTLGIKAGYNWNAFRPSKQLKRL